MLSADTVNRNNNDDSAQAKISVIIVTFNAADTLQACLDSIYRQNYSNIEIIVIDGGSADDTVKILRENADNIYYWKSERDEGIYDAMNKGLTHATGEWIYFIGADDELYDAFTDLAYELKDSDKIYYGRVLCSGLPTFPVNSYAFVKLGICHQAMIYPRAVFEKNNFNLNYKISADYALNMMLYNSKAFHFVFKDHLVAKFNDTGISSVAIDQVFENDRPGMVLKYFGIKIWLRFMFWRFKKNYTKKKKAVI